MKDSACWSEMGSGERAETKGLLGPGGRGGGWWGPRGEVKPGAAAVRLEGMTAVLLFYMHQDSREGTEAVGIVNVPNRWGERVQQDLCSFFLVV